MRRFAIGLAILLALSLMLAAVAVAAPSFCDPANPRYDPENKLCTTTTTSDSTTTTTAVLPDPVSDDWGGHTCADYKLLYPGSDWIAFEPVDAYSTDADFTLELKGGEKGCVDVIAPAGVWLVNVTTDGGRNVMMIPRDSFSPGDSCGGAIINGDATGDYTLPLPDDPRTEIPASTVNACGTEYGEQPITEIDGVWVDDGLPEMEKTGEVNPLAFIVSAGGSPKSTTWIQVTLPDPPPAP